MDKVVEVQQQVKNNAADLQDYLRDLDNWTKQMEAKDEQLKLAKKNKVPSTVVSNSVLKNTTVVKDKSSSPPKKPRKEPEVVSSTKNKSVKPRDYSEWDKFDVDAACEEVEKSQSDTDGGTSEDEELEYQKLVLEAVSEKDRGNEWFKKGNFDKAIERYTRGMTLDPTNAVLPANRAMALLKKGQYGAAETDCTLALSIDNTYIKAFQRRASARVGMDKYKLAIDDYEEVLKLEPSNKAAQSEKLKLMEKLNSNIDNSVGSNISKPSNFNEKMKGALLPNNYAKPNKRVQDNRDTDKLKDADSIKQIKGTKNDQEVGDIVLPINKPAHLRSKKPLKRVEIFENTVANKELIKSKVKVDKSEVEDVKINTVGLTKQVEKEIANELSKVEIMNTIPAVPSSSAKFLTDWKTLKSIVNRAKYLQQFKSTDYGKVFKSSMDGILFSEIVQVLNHMVQRGVMPEIIVHQLNGLSRLPRISAISMFMSKHDLDKLKYVIDELEMVHPQDINQWKKTFAV